MKNAEKIKKIILYAFKRYCIYYYILCRATGNSLFENPKFPSPDNEKIPENYR